MYLYINESTLFFLSSSSGSPPFLPVWSIPLAGKTLYSTNNPFLLCHSSILPSFPYSSCTFFFPSGHRTQAGLEFAMTQTISSGTGKSVSIAEANGWISSGQWRSHSQSMELQLEQKLRSEEHSSCVALPRSLMALYFLVF